MVKLTESSSAGELEWYLTVKNNLSATISVNALRIQRVNSSSACSAPLEHVVAVVVTKDVAELETEVEA